LKGKCQSGTYPRNDWRPLGLGAGAALTAPLIVLPVVGMPRRQSVKECLGVPVLIISVLTLL
jgi:hypothetical protein